MNNQKAKWWNVSTFLKIKWIGEEREYDVIEIFIHFHLINVQKL